MSLTSEGVMRFSDLLTKLVSSAPFVGREEAERALVAALETLGYVLPVRLVLLLEAALPSECAAPLAFGRASSQNGQQTELGTPSPPTLERIAEVCAALALVLPADLVQDIVRELPSALSSAFEPSSLRAMRSLPRKFNPHGDVKLSSARGLTQEREHETLAEGRPGPDRKRDPNDS